MTNDLKLKKHLVWRLRILMAERDIRSATELKRRLENIGYELTSAHASRIVNELPQRISTDLLNALLTVLDCGISDLLAEEPVGQGEEEGGRNSAREPSKQETSPAKGAGKASLPGRVIPIHDEEKKILLGPRVRSLSKPPEE
jgi:DNA-binding Xre family transcriptional regulator